MSRMLKKRNKDHHTELKDMYHQVRFWTVNET